MNYGLTLFWRGWRYSWVLRVIFVLAQDTFAQDL